MATKIYTLIEVNTDGPLPVSFVTETDIDEVVESLQDDIDSADEDEEEEVRAQIEPIIEQIKAICAKGDDSEGSQHLIGKTHVLLVSEIDS